MAAMSFTRARYRVRALAKLHSASLPRSDRAPLALASCVASLRTTLERAHRYRAPAESAEPAGPAMMVVGPGAWDLFFRK